MKNSDRIINFEVIGGWPIYKMNLKDILQSLGAEINNEYLSFKLTDPILEIYPIRFHSDVMGYGVDEQYIVAADSDHKTYINLFTESEMKKSELNERIKEIEEEEKKHGTQ